MIYTWNSTRIDGTDILSNTVAIRRKFQFSINIHLSVLPNLTQNNTESMIDYSRPTDSIRRFFSFILKILIVNCFKTHAKHVNNNQIL